MNSSVSEIFRTFQASAKTILLDEAILSPVSRSLHRRTRPAGSLRLLRRTGAWLTVLASVGLGGPANAESPDRWRPNPNVGLLEGLTLRIHWLDSTAELREAAENSGQKINETDLKGFSILKRNKQTGEYICDVYVVNMTGANVDGDRTTTFGHEVLHCFGLKHE